MCVALTKYLAGSPDHGGLCKRCGHDLFVKTLGRISNGKVYCTNQKCVHFNDPHPTGQSLNTPKKPRRAS